MGQAACPRDGFLYPGQRLVRKAEHQQANAFVGGRAHRRVVPAVYKRVGEILWLVEDETPCSMLTN
jgi:hypothetical protein